MLLNPYRFVASATYRDEVMADSPVMYWRLGEASGTTAADETGTNPGTYVGSPTLGVTGAKSGNTAVTFGSSKYCAASFAGHNTNVSIECWVNYSSAAAEARLLAWGNLSGNRASIQLSGVTTGRIRGIVGNMGDGGSATRVGTEVVLSTGWHHVVMTFNGTNMLLYIDGAQVASDTFAATTLGTTSQAFVAAARRTATTPTFGSYLSGSLDEVAVYNSVLSGARILAHYNAP